MKLGYECRWYEANINGIVIVLRSASMAEIYQEHQDDDGFLYVAYSGESTFG